MKNSRANKSVCKQSFLVYLLFVWLTHALLRAFLIFRKDAFGFPYVGKADWYIFHALAIDFLWIFLCSSPFLLMAAVAGRLGRAPQEKAAFYALVIFHSILFPLTVIDHEVQRFMGMHLDFSILRTYGNTASIREVLGFLGSDLSLPYLPLFLLFCAAPLPLFLCFSSLPSVRRSELNRSKAPLRPYLVLTVIGLSCYIFLYHVWPGGFRMRKLKPFVSIVYDEIGRKLGGAPNSVMDSESARLYQGQWIREQGDSSWIFPSEDYPYLRMPLFQACSATLALRKRGSGSGSGKTTLLAACSLDRDGDSFPAFEDCDDGNASVYPGGVDIPGNGVDEDCDGIDLKPRNIVFLILESHRAVNAGFLHPFGAPADGTPYLNTIAESSYVWSRFSVSGLPTVSALISTHLSILQHPTRHISSDFANLNHRSFSSVLGERGYKTHFFSAADPAWDSQIPWLRQWYQGFSYNRERETDGLMFAHMAQWMRDSLDTDRSFLVTAMTKTNHYPFNSVEDTPAVPAGATLQEKMLASMKYTEACLESFMRSISGEPWFPNTIFIFMADHGFPLSEHGSSSIGYGLYSESTWIPFILLDAGKKRRQPDWRHHPAGQIDVGPTLLALAGIRTSNHFMGHDLLRPNPGNHSLILSLKGEQGVIEHGRFRAHGPISSLPRDQGNEIFDVLADRLEMRNLLPERNGVFDSLMPFLSAYARLNTVLVEKNRLWPMEPIKVFSDSILEKRP